MDHVTDDTPTLPSAGSGVGSPIVAVGGTLAGRYHVRARLGRGATKEVFLAYDARMDREVALAFVVTAAGSDVAAARERFEREAQVTGRLGDHRNIVTAYDTGELDGVPYLVLRAMLGGSLADLLERDRPSFADAIRVGGEIASALAHAHSRGIVHRDVKPDNVLLAGDGTAALGDFGIAYRAGQDRLTVEGGVLGTVRYLAPERIRGEATAAGDLYALGVTLYELVTGLPPFTGTDPDSVLNQHLSVAPEVPSRREPGVPRALERLILALLSKQPSRRPASAAAVVEMLSAMASSAPAGPVGPPRAVTPHATAAIGEAARRLPSTPGRRRPSARRVVSVLALSADVDDPEALHAVLDAGADVIERHGGSVEHYLGDTLVGIFGIDASQGDDALRAARAAVELRASTDDLRIGIETGEVFVGTDRNGAPIATGAPIAAAGRLAERAHRGDILVGDGTRGAVTAEATIEATTGRLLELSAEQPALLRASGTPFVGREHELAELLAAFASVRDEGTCRLVTVVGSAGIGKSRLAGEFLAAVREEATILAGRCLAYGEGTTYRALAEIVRGLGSDPRRRIEELLAGDEQAIRGILGAVGLSDEPAPAEETAWALRLLLQRLARQRPLVVAVEDIHWADRALLDLLDHLVALSSGSPILLVCLTRPELLDAHPAWREPHGSRSVLRLDALTEADACELAERLGASGPAARIAARAEGNPLFVEQLVAVDAGDDGELPASIQAVLAARIDRLAELERTLLLHAAVEGRTFHAGALASTLSESDRAAIATGLAALAEQGLIGGDRPEFAGEEAYHFTHALIRDAAYAGVPKLERARLHADVADWLDARPAAADEIVGFHLEQACGLAAELGQAGDRERVLAQRAVQRLSRASHAALARSDPASAGALLERSLALLSDDDSQREELLPELGASLYEAGRMTEATRVLDDAIASTLEPRARARAQVEREIVRLETDASVGTEQSSRVADTVLPVLERAGDERGQCRAWSLRAQVAWTAGQIERSDEACRRAAACARRAGSERELFDIVGWRATAAVLGPTPVDEAIRRCEDFREIVRASPVAVAWVVNPLAALHAMRGELDLAAEHVAEAKEIFDKLGAVGAIVSHLEAYVWMLSGRPDLAETALRGDVDSLTEMGESRSLATTLAMLAQVVYAQGRPEEAAELCTTTSATVAADDILTQVAWRGVHARLLADDGRCDEALARAREAVALIEPTDLVSHRAEALLDLADVLRTCGRAGESQPVVVSALALCQLKGNVAIAARARSRGDGRSEV